MALLTTRTTRKRQHEYQTCDDEDCPRFPCRVYREGFANGRAVGYAEGYGTGYAEGYSDGYQEGFSAGVSSAG